MSRMNAAGGAKASVEDLFGILSLMFWALVMVVTVLETLAVNSATP
jgi:K+ transporter